MQFLGQEQPELPEVALPIDGDHAINQGDSVVRLDNLLDVQVLQWLYHNREEGITFRSDGNQQLRCFYDSGHAGREVVWLRNLLAEMGLEQHLQEPTIIEGDNLQANRWASSDLITTGNKFIERDYFKVKEWIEAGYLEPRHVPGKENPADLLTKIVDVPTQQHLGPWLSGKKMLNEPGPALKDMRPKEKTGKANCACTSCSEVQQMWWQRTWMV